MTKKVKNLPPCLVLTCGRKVYDPTPEVAKLVRDIVREVDAHRKGTDLVEQLMVELELRMSVPTRAERRRAIAHHQDWLDYLDSRKKAG